MSNGELDGRTVDIKLNGEGRGKGAAVVMGPRRVSLVAEVCMGWHRLGEGGAGGEDISENLVGRRRARGTRK